MNKKEICVNCGHNEYFHKPNQYYKGNDCHYFINDDPLNYERCKCKKFVGERDK